MIKSKNFTKKAILKYFEDAFEWSEDTMDEDQVIWYNQLADALVGCKCSISDEEDEHSNLQLVIKIDLREL